jgi:hypothetical protein
MNIKIAKEEWWPIFVIKENPRKNCTFYELEITPEFYEEYSQTMNKFDEIQNKLREMLRS